MVIMFPRKWAFLQMKLPYIYYNLIKVIFKRPNVSKWLVELFDDLNEGSLSEYLVSCSFAYSYNQSSWDIQNNSSSNSLRGFIKLPSKISQWKNDKTLSDKAFLEDEDRQSSKTRWISLWYLIPLTQTNIQTEFWGWFSILPVSSMNDSIASIHNVSLQPESSHIHQQPPC